MKGQTCLKPIGAHGGQSDPVQSNLILCKNRKFQKCLGVATSTCMWLHVVVANDFWCIHWSDAFFCIFLINLINLSSAAMATEFAISRPMGQRPELAFGCCFWVGSPVQAAHFRAHPTLGASTLARWHACRPKKEISVKCRPAQKNV